MNLSDLASLATLVSGIAVLVSLFYLSLQIRQNTKHSRALIQQGRAGRIVDIAMRQADFRAEAGLDKCFEGFPEADPQDVTRFLGLARAQFISLEDSFYQHREGLMDEQAFESFEIGVRVMLGRQPRTAAAWLFSREMYEPQFRIYMDSLLDSVAVESAQGGRAARWKAALETLARKSAGTKKPTEGAP